MQDGEDRQKPEGADPDLDHLDYKPSLKAAMAHHDKVCKWTYDNCDGCYETSCKNMFEFTVDGIRQNEFKYCPYCGGKIQEGE